MNPIKQEVSSRLSRDIDAMKSKIERGRGLVRCGANKVRGWGTVSKINIRTVYLQDHSVVLIRELHDYRTYNR